MRVDYCTGEAVNIAVPLHSVVCFALGSEQRIAFGNSHSHIVRCRRLSPCIVNLKSKQPPSVKRNSRSYSYVVVFRTKKGQTLLIEEAAPSSGGRNFLNERSSARALTRQSIPLSNSIKDHMEKTVFCTVPPSYPDGGSRVT